MAVIPEISMGVKGIELADPVAQYGRIVGIQNAQHQNRLAQMQIQQAEREIAKTNALNQAYANAYGAGGKLDVNALRRAVASSGYGSELPGIEKDILYREEAQAKITKTKTDIAESSEKILDARLKRRREELARIDPYAPDAAEKVMQWHIGNHADDVIGPTLAAQGITLESSAASVKSMTSDPAAMPQSIMKMAMGLEKFTELNKPQYVTMNLGDRTVVDAYFPLTGERRLVNEGKVKLSPYQQAQLNNERRRLAMEERRTRVAEQNAALEKDPEYQRRMAYARQVGAQFAKGDAAATEVVNDAIIRATRAVDAVDKMIGKRDEKGRLVKGTAPHPGFASVVGTNELGGLPYWKVMKGTDAASFQALYDQVMGTVAVEAYETIRGAGQITEKETAFATAALTNMKTATTEDEFVKAALEYQRHVRAGVRKIQARAVKAEERSAVSGGTVTPRTKSGGNVDMNNPLLK